MLKKLIGILTFLAMVAFITLMVLLSGQGIMFQASMAKLTMTTFVLLVVLCGLHLLETHCEPKKIARVSIWSLGLIVLILGILVSYNIVDYTASWNHLIALGIIYITLVQLQLLKWEKSKALLKVFGLLTLLSNLYLTVYFMAKLSMPKLGMVTDVAVVTSVFAFLIGLILSRQKKSAKSQEQAA